MMRDKGRHLCDEELVLAANGELARRTRRVRRHLDSCVQCRTKAANFELTMADLAGTQKRSLEPPSIAGPRARLLARMAAEPAHNLSLSSRLVFSSAWLAGAFGLAVMVAAFAVGIALRRLHAPDGHLSTATAERGVLPNRNFTPGAARVASLQEICALPHEEVVKEVPPSERQRVLDEYGIPRADAADYEVDYLITPGLGGDDDIRNLWPEPYRSATWNAHLKDTLEERLHEMVCSNQIDLSVAQQAIAGDWISAYQKYVASPPAERDGVKRL